MGLRGPPKTPTAILKLKGSWRGNDRPLEPQLEQVLDCPAPKELKAAGKRVWEHVVPLLTNARVLSTGDLYTLSRYCICYQDWINAKKTLDEMGICNEQGNTRTLFYAVQKMEDRLLQYEKQFGLTPASRPSIQVTGNIDDNQDDEKDFD